MPEATPKDCNSIVRMRLHNKQRHAVWCCQTRLGLDHALMKCRAICEGTNPRTNLAKLQLACENIRIHSFGGTCDPVIQEPQCGSPDLTMSLSFVLVAQLLKLIASCLELMKV